MRMYRSKRTTAQRNEDDQESSISLQHAPPLLTVSDHPENDDCCPSQQKRLEDAFLMLLGRRHSMTLTKSLKDTIGGCSGIETDPHLRFLESYLSDKLFEAFRSSTVERFECHVNCALVAMGGFGGTWHHDAISQLTTDTGQVCEYLGLCYLHGNEESGKCFPWLECALLRENDSDDPQELFDCFCPVSTENGLLLVLRNDCMMHRTPALCNLVPHKGGAPDERRFFYVPFRALDSSNQPVILAPTLWDSKSWRPYDEKTIQTRIVAKLIQS